MLTDRRAVRIAIMRSTVHLVTAEDCRFLRPLHAAFLERALLTSTWRTGLDDLDLGAVVAAGRALVEEQPLTFRELGVRLAERWPSATRRRSPRRCGRWRRWSTAAPGGGAGQARWSSPPPSTAGWRRRSTSAALDEMVLRYLAAFGPTSVMDVQAWSGLTRLKEVTDRLGDRVRRFRNEAGRELLDLPDAPRPDPDTPAPVRFLPDYDNVVLSHADRSRIVDDDVKRVQRVDQVLPGTVLVDGRVAAMWSVDQAKARPPWWSHRCAHSPEPSARPSATRAPACWPSPQPRPTTTTCGSWTRT